MKNKLFFYFVLMSNLGVAQKNNVGINTTTPQTKLHISGSLQSTKELVTGNNGTKGPGANGDILISQGAGKAPEWRKLEDAFVPQEAGLLKTSIASWNIADREHKVVFTDVKLQLAQFAKVSPSKDSFTIKKPGFYLITAYINYELTSGNGSRSSSSNSPVTTSIYANGTAISSILNNYTNSSTEAYQTLSITQFLSQGDVISLKGNFIRDFKFRDASLSLQYFGKP